MIDHISVGVRDLARARDFYDAVLPALGFRRVWQVDGGFGYGADDERPRFWINTPLDESRPAGAGNGSHIAFTAKTRVSVDEFYKAALAAGATDNGAPGRRDYTPTYYAAFVRDPDGHAIEAVFNQPD
jgi:catechol 2,3-dioxygenase-like lactoylglutathione lyase family enzyme